MIQEDLVFDVGVNNGDDTAHYLSRGFRVVGVEADIDMIRSCETRFADEITLGRLTLLHCAIAAADGPVAFFVSEGNRGVWSSLDRAEASRGGLSAREISVEGRRFRSLMLEYGTPYYAKIDIEGADALCLRDLDETFAPTFVSFEANEGSLSDVIALANAGYTRFKLISQFEGFRQALPPDLDSLSGAFSIASRWCRRRLRPVTSRIRRWNRRAGGIESFADTPLRETAKGMEKFVVSSSGPMSDRTPGNWLSLEELFLAWIYHVRRTTTSDWFDVHATR